MLITGNLGYVGTALTDYLARCRPTFEIVGFDAGYFPPYFALDNCPPTSEIRQISGDIRDIYSDQLLGFDAVVHLAAISNDPMGSLDERLTYDVNVNGTLHLARLCKKVGVRHMVFASSCSVYGQSGNTFRNENDETAPLTAYARSKVRSEKGLAELANERFTIDCLRFATAAGWSPNLRSDLVVNDLTIGALRDGRIVLKSDGSAWRPIIDVEDMARAITWSLEASPRSEGFRVVNIGSASETYDVRSIAELVRAIIPQTSLEISENVAGDDRSYKVDFAKFLTLGAGYQPKTTLEQIVERLVARWHLVQTVEPENLVRLRQINALLEDRRVDSELRWR